MNWLKYAAKAITSGLTTAISCLLLILSGSQTLADVTFVQWLWISLMILGSFGITYVVPSGQKPPSRV